MTVIAEKPWSYVVFNDDEKWILTFLIGGVVEVDISIKLTSEEVKKIKDDSTFIEKLINDIKQNREHFSSREVNPPIWPS